MKRRGNDVIEIDLIRLIKVLWSKVFIIIPAMLITGGVCFTAASFFLTPKYESSVLIYVNSNNQTGEKLSISQSELTTAKTLVDTYTIILSSRATLNAVIEKTGVDYTYKTLLGMISAHSVNNTELFKIVVTSPSPQEAVMIANCIAEILPEKISEIVLGSSARIVDYAVLPTEQATPRLSMWLMLGVMAGAFVSAAIIILKDLLDTKIRSEDYLRQNFDLPILAVIPDLLTSSESSCGYYSRAYSHKV